MNQDFTKLIELAAEVASSGRWKAANNKIEQLAANPGKDNDWWVQVVGCLCAQVFSEYLLLKKAYEERRNDTSTLIAWRDRNLLELAFWSIYCSLDNLHARRFYEDAGRDTYGLFSAFTKWGIAKGAEPEWLDVLTGAKQDLSRQAAAVGFDSLDVPYKRVTDAATECGFGDNFTLSYKMLSKFAHPTAMQVLGVPDEEKISNQQFVFFSQGCLFFRGAFEALEGMLRNQTSSCEER